MSAKTLGHGKRCFENNHIHVQSERGFLSSQHTEETEEGSVKCPWLIEVPNGMKINVTLWDFGTGIQYPDDFNLAHSSTHMPGVRHHSREGHRQHGHHLFRRQSHQTRVYTSETNQIEVRIQYNANRNRTKYFLLEYYGNDCLNQFYY